YPPASSQVNLADTTATVGTSGTTPLSALWEPRPRGRLLSLGLRAIDRGRQVVELAQRRWPGDAAGGLVIALLRTRKRIAGESRPEYGNGNSHRRHARRSRRESRRAGLTTA